MPDLDVYKCRCDGCDVVVEVIGGTCDCEVSCCGETMARLRENTVDASKEKHVPVCERVDGGWLVKVGSVAHPMEEAHYIPFIELIAGGLVQRRRLAPGEAPQATFKTDATDVTARAYCNLHGLWKGYGRW